MADGKPKCKDNKQALTLGRLNSMQSIASQALVGTQSQGRDPLFLPKETFQKILLLLDSKTKVTCIQVNQTWNRQLKHDPALWRECLFPNRSNPSLAISYFSRWSLDTLVSIDLLFKMLDSEDLDEILEDLHKSVATLQSLKFKGYLYQTTFTSKAIKLASKCRNLKYFDYELAEDRYFDPEKKQKRIEERRDREENYRDYDSDDMMSDDSEDDYDETDECDFTDYKFKGFPEIVRLRTSQLTRVYFRETDFFKSVKELTLELCQIDHDDWKSYKVTRNDIRMILKSCSKSATSIRIVNDPVQDFKSEKEDLKGSLSMPKLRYFALHLYYYLPRDYVPQSISAPMCDKFNGGGVFKREV